IVRIFLLQMPIFHSLCEKFCTAEREGSRQGGRRMRGKIPSSRGIEAFLTLADLGSVRAAASALNLTPSAITHRVKALEADVGLDLFERRGREISISPDGTRYREKILGHVNAIREATDNLAKRERVDRIRIASIDLFHSNWLMPRID